MSLRWYRCRIPFARLSKAVLIAWTVRSLYMVGVDVFTTTDLPVSLARRSIDLAQAFEIVFVVGYGGLSWMTGVLLFIMAVAGLRHTRLLPAHRP